MILTIKNYVYIQRIKVEGNKPKLRNICFGTLKGPFLSLPPPHPYVSHIFQNFFNKCIILVKKVNLKE